MSPSRLRVTAPILVSLLLICGYLWVRVASLEPGFSPIRGEGRIRVVNSHILQVFREAKRRSAAFRDLVATLERLDRIVYVQEGRCRHQQTRSCLEVMPTPAVGNLVIKLDPRQSINAIVEQLAHQLYHASEIAREPHVRDGDAARLLFERSGERRCQDASGDCSETRAAASFGSLVKVQFAEATRTLHQPQ